VPRQLRADTPAHCAHLFVSTSPNCPWKDDNLGSASRPSRATHPMPYADSHILLAVPWRLITAPVRAEPFIIPSSSSVNFPWLLALTTSHTARWSLRAVDRTRCIRAPESMPARPFREDLAKVGDFCRRRYWSFVCPPSYTLLSLATVFLSLSSPAYTSHARVLVHAHR